MGSRAGRTRPRRASFYRPHLLAKVEAGDGTTLRQLLADIAIELASAGFNVRAVEAHVHRARPGGTPVIAHAVLRRYGHEFDTVVRMDCAGEVYIRLADDSDAGMREVGDLDA